MTPTPLALLRSQLRRPPVGFASYSNVPYRAPRRRDVQQSGDLAGHSTGAIALQGRAARQPALEFVAGYRPLARAADWPYLELAARRLQTTGNRRIALPLGLQARPFPLRRIRHYFVSYLTQLGRRCAVRAIAHFGHLIAVIAVQRGHALRRQSEFLPLACPLRRRPHTSAPALG